MASDLAIPSNEFSVTLPDGSIKVLYKPHIKQLEYHMRNEPNVLFWGGRGSGKSLCGRWDAHMRAMSYPGFKYCILRRTYPELQKSHLTSIGMEMRDLGGKWNATDKIATYPNGSVGFFAHCQTDEDVLKLLSSEFYLMFFDELSTFQWEQFVMLSASCRVAGKAAEDGVKAMVRAATNPLGPSAQEVLKYFVNHDVDLEDDPDYLPEDWYSIHANAEDNPSLPLEQYKKRFSGLPAHVRKAWVDGEFIMENALFDFRPTIEAVDPEDGIKKKTAYHVIDTLDINKIIKTCEIYRAIDSGWFPDPTVCLWIAHLGKRYIVFREETWYRTTAADVAKDIKRIEAEMAEAAGVERLRVVTTYCDPSMDVNTQADIRTIKELYEVNGIPMECSINDRKLFPVAMNHALVEEVGPGVPKIQFYSRGCKILIKTIPMMSYDSKDPEKMADNRHDHWVITCCYFLMSHGADDRRGSIGNDGKSKKWLISKGRDAKPLGYHNVRSNWK